MNIHKKFLCFGLLISMVLGFTSFDSNAQSKNQMVRIAKIQVDPAQLDQYNLALKEQMTAAIRLEPGVLSYHAVADKKNPASITILEVYADSSAYQRHIQTPHFRKYKSTVENMVQGLELIDVDVIGFASKKK